MKLMDENFKQLPRTNLYLLNLLDTHLGQPDIAYNVLQPILSLGFELNQTIYLFESECSLNEINDLIKKNTKKNFLYFLFDISDSVDSDKFKGYLTAQLPCSEDLAARLQKYRKVTTNSNNIVVKGKITQETIDSILDKISKLGINSLTPEEKKILDSNQ